MNHWHIIDGLIMDLAFSSLIFLKFLFHIQYDIFFKTVNLWTLKYFWVRSHTVSLSGADMVLKVHHSPCSQITYAKSKTDLVQIFRDGTFFAWRYLIWPRSKFIVIFFNFTARTALNQQSYLLNSFGTFWTERCWSKWFWNVFLQLFYVFLQST